MLLKLLLNDDLTAHRTKVTGESISGVFELRGHSRHKDLHPVPMISLGDKSLHLQGRGPERRLGCAIGSEIYGRRE